MMENECGARNNNRTCEDDKTTDGQDGYIYVLQQIISLHVIIHSSSLT